MGAFDDVRLPENIEQGATGGPTFSTGIITTASGQEQRIQNWSVARNTYTISYGISDMDWQAVRAFFYARRGRARGFRFKDWTDFECINEPVQQGTTIQLVKTYQDEIGIQYIRAITRVVPGTLLVFHGDKDVTVNFTESFGRLKPVNGYVSPGELHATFEYDLPVRFDVDEMVLTADTIIAASIESLNIVELIENSATLNGDP